MQTLLAVRDSSVQTTTTIGNLLLLLSERRLFCFICVPINRKLFRCNNRESAPKCCLLIDWVRLKWSQTRRRRSNTSYIYLSNVWLNYWRMEKATTSLVAWHRNTESFTMFDVFRAHSSLSSWRSVETCTVWWLTEEIANQDSGRV